MTTPLNDHEKIELLRDTLTQIKLRYRNSPESYTYVLAEHTLSATAPAADPVLAATSRPSPWRPIADAPKDGTVVLNKGRDGSIVLGPHPACYSQHLTHFMPIPPLPVVKESLTTHPAPAASRGEWCEHIYLNGWIGDWRYKETGNIVNRPDCSICGSRRPVPKAEPAPAEYIRSQNSPKSPPFPKTEPAPVDPMPPTSKTAMLHAEALAKCTCPIGDDPWKAPECHDRDCPERTRVAPKPAETRITWERTGEYRSPKQGEFYEATDAGRPQQATWGTLTFCAWILTRIESTSAPRQPETRREE